MSGRAAIRHNREPRARSPKSVTTVASPAPRQVLPELPQVIHAPPGPDHLASRQRPQRGRAPLLDIPGRQLRIGQDHGGEEVTADERRAVGRRHTAAGVLGGISGAAEVTQAVPELGGQFGLIEIPDPARVIVRPAPLELLRRRGQRPVARLRVTQPGQRPRLHRVEVRRQGGGGDPGRAGPCRAGQVGGLAEPAGVGGLVAHRVQDAGPQQPVPGRLRQAQGLDEIPLRQRASRRAVIAHPRRQQGRLGYGGEQGSADRLAVAAAEQPVAVAAEVLDQGLAGVPAAEPVIELPEHLDRRVEALDVAYADAHAARPFGLRRADWLDQPAERGIIPGGRVNPAALKYALVGEVGLPQRRDVPGRLRWRGRVLQADLGGRGGAGLRHGEPGCGRRAGIESQCLPGRWRQPQSVGEGREDRDFLRLVLARLVVTQPVLMQAGQAGDLLLGKAVGVKDPDDVAEIAFRACVETSWRAQTRSTILRTSEIGRTTARFPFPWSLANR